MSTDDTEKRIREKFITRLEEALDDPEEGRKAAVLSMAARWLDGMGRKHEAEAETNEYADQTRKGTRATMSGIDMESDDPATG